MLGHEPDEGRAGSNGRVPAKPPRAGVHPGASPDREVLDAARSRLCGRSASPVPDPSLTHTVEDLEAVAGVRLAARYGAQPAPGPLDLGASLALVGNLRLYLDAVEADLLDAAAGLGMSWDLIAAILGLPADEARHRLRELRSHPAPR